MPRLAGAYVAAAAGLFLAAAGCCRGETPWIEFGNEVESIGQAVIRNSPGGSALQLAQMIHSATHAKLDPYMSYFGSQYGMEYNVLVWGEEIHPLYSDKVITGSATLEIHHLIMTVVNGMVPSFTCDREGMFPGSLPQGWQDAKDHLAWPCFRGGAVAIGDIVERSSGKRMNCMVFYFSADLPELNRLTSERTAAERQQLYRNAAEQCVSEALLMTVTNLSSTAVCIRQRYKPSGIKSGKLKDTVGLRGVAVLLEVRDGANHDYGLFSNFGGITINCISFSSGFMPPAKICHTALFSSIENEHWRKGGKRKRG